MAVRPEEIASIIRQQIEQFGGAVTAVDVGTVVGVHVGLGAEVALAGPSVGSSRASLSVDGAVCAQASCGFPPDSWKRRTLYASWTRSETLSSSATGLGPTRVRKASAATPPACGRAIGTTTSPTPASSAAMPAMTST